MPPQISLAQCLKAPEASRIASCLRSFTSSSPTQASAADKKRRHRDPYAIAQAKARKAANLSRQAVLANQRKDELGDPVRGTETDYVRSFDHADPENVQSPSPSVRDRIKKGEALTPVHHRNFFVDQSEYKAGLERSQYLATPVRESGVTVARGFTTDVTEEQRHAQREIEHDTAAEALRRISSLSLGNAKDRLRVNIRRCVADFGRHNTATFLPAKPQSAHAGSNISDKTPAAGPDTGSSEVQIAILTAKIRAVADHLQGRGKQDKVNKRNLRLLVHKRQKLLKYLRRKERGGPRWQYVTETLGLSDGTWKGEITM